jgi:hypothetical protein
MMVGALLLYPPINYAWTCLLLLSRVPKVGSDEKVPDQSLFLSIALVSIYLERITLLPAGRQFCIITSTGRLQKKNS